MDGDAGFRHERDPSCSYFEEMSKRCSVARRDAAQLEGEQGVEDPEARGARRPRSREPAELHCKVLRKLMRRCPKHGGRVEEVERVETESVEPGGGMGMGMGILPEFRMRGRGPGEPREDSFGFEARDPFDMMHRGMDQFMDEFFSGAFGGVHPHPRGDFRDEGSMGVPPHHRYGRRRAGEQDPSMDTDDTERQQRQHRRRWNRYAAEEV